MPWTSQLQQDLYLMELESTIPHNDITSYRDHRKHTSFLGVSGNQVSPAEFSTFFHKNFLKCCLNVSL
ncbi:hypothetical protein KM043_016097 [Ampulex compressa]|nr:hypothetical protein KM043_016097 [Ampulex compressa]